MIEGVGMRAWRQRQDLIDRLRSLDVLADCTDDELRDLDRLFTEVTFVAGQRLTREGAGALEFMIVREGTVGVERGGEQVATLGEGSFVGEIGLLDRAPRNATVVALEDVRAFVLNAGEFEELLETAPSLRQKIERAAGDRRA